MALQENHGFGELTCRPDIFVGLSDVYVGVCFSC